MRLNAVLRKLDNKMNPIAVKELRQLSRGKFLKVILIGFLMAQLTVTGLFSASGSSNLGPDLFHALLAFLTATCALLIPVYAGFRLANERAGANLDLLFTSALKPAAIVWGKTLSAGVLAAMIYSVCMPFIFMTYLLRGIDLPLAFLLLAISFVYVMLAAQIGIMIGCMPANRILKGIVGLVAMGAVFAFQLSGTWFLAGWGGFAIDDPLTLIASAGIMAGIGALLVWTLIAAMCFILSTAFISPPSANRAFVPRLYLTAVWAVSMIVVSIWIRVSHSYEPLFYWFAFTCAVFAWTMPFSVSERDQIGPRVRQQIPRSGWRRFLAFLFYSGSAGGALWAVIILVFTFLSAWFNAAALSRIDMEWFLELSAFIGVASLNLWTASAGAVLVRRKFLKKRVSNGSTWLIAVGVYIAFNTAFVFMLIGTGASFNAPLWAMALFGALVGMDDPPIGAAAVAALLLGFACLPWIGRQIYAFKPPAPEPPLAAEREPS